MFSFSASRKTAPHFIPISLVSSHYCLHYSCVAMRYKTDGSNVSLGNLFGLLQMLKFANKFSFLWTSQSLDELLLTFGDFSFLLPLNETRFLMRLLTFHLGQWWPHFPLLHLIFIVLAPVNPLISSDLYNNSWVRKSSPLVLSWPWQKKRSTKKKRKQHFILQHLVQSAPWGWTPMGALAPVVKESGGFKPAPFFHSIKNAWEWSALWITCSATSNKFIYSP